MQKLVQSFFSDSKFEEELIKRPKNTDIPTSPFENFGFLLHR